MSPFTVLLLVAQACLIQSVFGCCGCGPAAPIVAPCAGPIFAPATIGLGVAPCAGPVVAPAPIGLGAGLGYGAGAGLGYGLGALGYGPSLPTTWGGEGYADLSVAGDLCVTGNTLVAGQIPVLGEICFAGPIPAAGSVTISGSCGYPCGCNSGFYY